MFAFRVVAVCAVVLLVLAVAGYFAYSTLRPPDIEGYATQGVSIAGLEDADFLITPAQLTELDCVSKRATGTGAGEQGQSKVGAVQAYGPLMETFLQSYGHTLSDFKRIKVFCKDGYTVILRPEQLEGEIILSVADDKTALAAYQTPLRMVIPGEATGRWAFGILRIEFSV
jgi:hypothetical protein